MRKHYVKSWLASREDVLLSIWHLSLDSLDTCIAFHPFYPEQKGSNLSKYIAEIRLLA